MVLADSTAPTSAARPGTPSPGHGGSSDGLSRVSALVSVSARLGLGRLYAQFDFGGLPPRSRDEVRASVATPSMLRSTIDEYVQAAASAEQAAALRDFADKPLIVLTAGSGHDVAWSVAQNRLARLSTNSAHRIIDGAAHQDLIVDEEDAAATTQAILDVVAAVRSKGAWSADPEPQQRGLGAPPRPGVGGLDDAGDCPASEAAPSWPKTRACGAAAGPHAAADRAGHLPRLQQPAASKARRRGVEHPVGVRYPSRSASLGRLPSCLAGGSVAGCPIQSRTPAAEVVRLTRANRAWSGPRQIRAPLPDALDGGRPGG
jgi:hypothetical protein